ncbi:MAG: PAS domain S-box protein [Candidatus Lokiarchaeota archaeon]|nr:PAS domain S-box protein [Candidatus Lokiarchaeota archaeon]
MDSENGGAAPGKLLGIVDEGKLFRHLFETSPNAIVLFDEKGIVRACNVWTEYMTGYPRAEIIGKVFLNLPFFTKEVMAQLALKYQELLSSRSGQLDRPVDVQVMRKNGSPRWVSLLGTTIQIDGRSMMQVIGVDIEARKRLELVLEEENRALKALDELRMQFVTDATHELKTPLTSVDGAIQLLDDNFSALDRDTINSLLKLVRRGSFRLKELIELLLDFSRIEAGHFSLKVAREDLSSVIKNAVRSVSFLAYQRRLRVTVGELPALQVDIDRTRIEQVVANLLTNAFKNTPPGGAIEVTMSFDRDVATVSVKDDGVGLTSNEISKLFTKFGKIDRTDVNAEINVTGSGLGLFISKEVIGKHGGRIWAESGGRMKGSTFSFTLPLGRGDEHALPI